MIRVDLRNYRSLREATWEITTGVHAVVGPNGAGKSTLLGAFKFLRVLWDRGLHAALASPYPSGPTKNWDAQPEEPVEIGLRLDETSRLDLRFQPTARNGEVSGWIRVEDGTASTYDREIRERSGDFPLRLLWTNGPPAGLDRFLRSITVFHDLDIWAIRDTGSPAAEDRHLQSRGANALTMLRKWFLTAPERHRYQFVLDGLREAFPGLVGDLDFDERGRYVLARIYRPGSESGRSISDEANGVISMLASLCALAGTPDGGIVLIDEPETALHPWAIRELVRRAAAWTERRGITAVLMTHSPVLLSELNATPERVHVLSEETGFRPRRLSDLRNPDWIAQFTLGELLVDGELGKTCTSSSS